MLIAGGFCLGYGYAKLILVPEVIPPSTNWTWINVPDTVNHVDSIKLLPKNVESDYHDFPKLTPPQIIEELDSVYLWGSQKQNGNYRSVHFRADNLILKKDIIPLQEFLIQADLRLKALEQKK